jgi:hypothetical protein
MTYEYKVCTLSGIGNSGVEDVLNQNASEGWRVFQITTAWVVFERPKPKQRPIATTRGSQHDAESGLR